MPVRLFCLAQTMNSLQIEERDEEHSRKEC